MDSDTTEHVCIIYIIKLTLDECKTLTKNSLNLSQQFPQTSAHFGRNKIRNKKTGKKHLASIPGKASCIIGGESRGIRISSRNNERIKTTNRNDGKYSENLRIGFVSNFTLFFVSTLYIIFTLCIGARNVKQLNSIYIVVQKKHYF